MAFGWSVFGLFAFGCVAFLAFWFLAFCFLAFRFRHLALWFLACSFLASLAFWLLAFWFLAFCFWAFAVYECFLRRIPTTTFSEALFGADNPGGSAASSNHQADAALFTKTHMYNIYSAYIHTKPHTHTVDPKSKP